MTERCCSQFYSNFIEGDDKSGIATFTIEDLTINIPLSDIKYFFQIVELFNKNDKLSKINAINFLKEKLNILTNEITNLDF